MPPTRYQRGQQDTTVPGVTTRSHKRVRDRVVPSSPAADPDDRTKSNSQSTSVALRRSSRHAAIVASRAEKANPATPQPQETETPPTSRSTSLVDDDDDDDEPVSHSGPSHRHATHQHDSKTDGSFSSGTRPETIATLDTKIIDLTEPSTPQKRKRARDDTDSGDDETLDEAPQRLTRSVSKKSRLHGPTDAENKTSGPSARRRAGPARASCASAQAPSTKGTLTPHQPTPGSSESNSDDEMDTNGEEPELPAIESSQFAQSVQEIGGPSSSPSDPPRTPIGADTTPTVENGCACAELSQPENSPVESFSFSDSVEESTCGGVDPRMSTIGSSSALYEGEVGQDPISPQDVDQPVGADVVILETNTDPSVEVVTLSSSMEFGNTPTLSQTEIESPIPVLEETTPRRDDTVPSNGPPSRSQSPYFGYNDRFTRFRNPPSSYLAPNPVRRGPKQPNVLRRDNFRYLPHATERAGLKTFAQTRRQFPRWMHKPSRTYFVGSRFIPQGRPAPEEDIDMDMDMEEVSVGVDIDGAHASSSESDVFLLSQPELYPSESSYTTPHMELDPDLDPTSLLNSQSMFYSPHSTTSDFLGTGPGPSSMQFTASSSGPYTQQYQEYSEGHLWSSPSMSSQMDEGCTTGHEALLQGLANGQAPAFEADGSEDAVPSGSMQPFTQDLPWEPSNWVNSPQFALFGVPPLPMQNMSMDSSLSAMTTYLTNEHLKSVDMDLVDGISTSRGQGSGQMQVQTQ